MLPGGLPMRLAVPDSGEHLVLRGVFAPGDFQVLTFGAESRLTTLSLSPGELIRARRAFVQLSARSLKEFRADWEFHSPCNTDLSSDHENFDSDSDW
jgi:hypothetical protein